MPTNFTVVPVDDAVGGSHSSAAAGSAKPSTLGQLFREEQDGDSSPESLTGSVKHFLYFFFIFFFKKGSSPTVGESFLKRTHKFFYWLVFIPGTCKEKRAKHP